MIIGCKNVKNEKVNKAIIEMTISTNQDAVYFSEMLLYVNFVESEKAKTAFATIIEDGPIIGYNPEFMESLSIPEIKFVLIHEMMHLLYCHINRGKNLDQNVFNVATDATINNEITCYFHSFTQQPEKSVMLDKKYNDILQSEAYYLWLLENHPELQSPSFKFDDVSFDNHDADNMQNIPAEDLEKANIKNIGTISGEFAKSIMEEITDSLRNRGFETSNITEMLDKLKKTKRNYLKEIKAEMCALLAGTHKQGTYMRPSRKQIWGLKGFKRYNNEINVILDVSGSMSGLFEEALGTIFKRNIVCNLIQCDTEVKDAIKIKSDKDIKNIKITGLGGTTLQPGIEYVKSHKELCHLPILLLTDGYCDSLNFTNVKGKSLILTTNEKPDIIGGNVKIIKIEE